ncbi:hypothetical protein [Galbibacter sp.]|uniref:hypothetical protein n=1 Tax=Galbibacter sp. TaxID=2918471 RepID=UPI003A93C3A4
MKFLFTIILLTTLIQNEADTLIGKYSYSQRHFSESLQLNADYTFQYELKMELFQQKINGNYNVVGDSLILNSFPQRDKIIVDEKSKKAEKNIFRVTNKSGHLVNYQLTITTDEGKVVELKDCYDKVKTNYSNIRSFHIIDTKGLKSPEYLIKGKQTNYFEIRFETIRVFENEKWFVNNGLKQINPIGMDGEFQNYNLTKQ